MTLTLSDIKEPNPQYTSSGESHGLIKVTGNSVPDSDGKRFKEKDRPAMKKLREEQSKMVKATYINKKGNAERLETTYCQWDGDPLLQYKFIPEHDYEIPKGLIDQINGKKVFKRSGLVDKSGRELTQDSTEGIDHRFVPVGF